MCTCTVPTMYSNGFKTWTRQQTSCSSSSKSIAWRWAVSNIATTKARPFRCCLLYWGLKLVQTSNKMGSNMAWKQRSEKIWIWVLLLWFGLDPSCFFWGEAGVVRTSQHLGLSLGGNVRVYWQITGKKVFSSSQFYCSRSWSCVPTISPTEVCQILSRTVQCEFCVLSHKCNHGHMV